MGGWGGRAENGANAMGAPAARYLHRGLLAAVMLAMLALAGCAGAAVSAQPTLAAPVTATAETSPAGTPSPAATSGPTPVEVTDLNAFRAKLTGAFQSNTWAKVAPLLSPAFSFQGLNSGGASLEMPDSANDLRNLYTSGGPWSQGPQYEVNIHYCYAGSTPTGQQMGFDGGGGSFLLAGIERWQGYWVVAWAFQDPLGGGDGCASG
ncbi:MAG: hypothetical protein ACRDHP_02035 [Ktedonobacterales bacterium]